MSVCVHLAASLRVRACVCVCVCVCVYSYVLCLERIPRHGSRDVVVFLHGVLDTSMSWVSAGKCAHTHTHTQAHTRTVPSDLCQYLQFLILPQLFRVVCASAVWV